VRDHNEPVNHIDFDYWPKREEITVDYPAGDVATVTQHDGSMLRLRKLAADYDPHDRIRAMNYVQEHAAKGEVVTGLLYVDPNPEDLHAHLNTFEAPFNMLGAKELCPGSAALEKINNALR
jgi:2-oxoglutarate ferredoxin oxidoreductase subunit beta